MRPGISAVEYYLPPNQVDAVKLGKRFDASREFVLNKSGMIYLKRGLSEKGCLDFAFRACKNLFNKAEVNVNRIGLIIVVTQTPDFKGIPHMSAVLHQRLGLSQSCIAFDVGLGCSGYVQSLQIAQALMLTSSIEIGLIVTSDQYSDRINASDTNTSLLFGDAASATLLRCSGERLVPSNFDSGICSDRSDALNHSGEWLHMNGRSVFEFVMGNIPLSIRRVASSSSKTLDDIDVILLHQGSKYIVDQLRKRLGISSLEKVPFLSSDIGNTISSSIPICLTRANAFENSLLLLSGFGVGLSWSSCLLSKWND